MGITLTLAMLAQDVVLVKPHGVRIVDDVTAQEFYTTVRGIFLRRLKSRIWMLVDIAEVVISSAGAKHYGPFMKRIEQEFTHGIIRFGKPEGLTKTAMLTQGILNSYASNVYADLPAAEEALLHLREEQKRKVQGMR